MRGARFVIVFVALVAFLVAIVPSVRADSIACAGDLTQATDAAQGTTLSSSAACPDGTLKTFCSCVPALLVEQQGPMMTVAASFTRNDTLCTCEYEFNQDTPANTFVLRTCAVCDPATGI